MPPMAAVQKAIDAYRAHNIPKAEHACRDILRMVPDHPTALCLLATLSCQKGMLGEGIAYCLRVLETSPHNVQALETLGDAYSQQGRHDKAAQAFLRATEVLPDDSGLWAKAGLALHQADALDPAVQAYVRALSLGAAYPETATDLGDALLELGKTEQALSAFRLGTTRAPTLPKAWYRLGIALESLGQKDSADCAEAFGTAYALAPQVPEYGYYHASCLYQQGDLHAALAVLQPVLENHPQMVQALILGCSVLGRLGDHHAAYCLGQQALILQPEQPAALVSMGTVCGFLGRYDEAQGYYLQALAVAPDTAAALANLAISRSITHPTQWTDALKMLAQADALAPDSPHILLNKGLIALTHQDFAQGWPLYRWREQVFHVQPSPHLAHLPSWQGPGLPPSPFVLCSEQGLGDQIMFAGLLAQVVAMGRTACVECDPRLCDLLRTAFPTLTIFATGEPPPIAQAKALSARIYLGDLCALLRPDEHAAPWLPASYLQAAPDLRARLRNRYQQHSRDRVIGLSWRSGNPTSGLTRSLDPARLSSLVDIAGTRWVSLQYGEPDPNLPPSVVIDPEVDPLSDVTTFAAQVAAMDLVVSVDNSTVHMAGALGVPTLALLSYGADWRWFQTEEYSLWYDSVRLLRQPCPDDWESVLCAAADQIRSQFE